MSNNHSVDYNKMSSNKQKPNRTNFNENRQTNNFKAPEKKVEPIVEPVEKKVEPIADPVEEKGAIIPQEAVEQIKDNSFAVRVEIGCLNIRTGPGKNYDKTGKYTGIGTFVITDVREGEGSDAGWGRLESGEGWISLEYATRV